MSNLSTTLPSVSLRTKPPNFGPQFNTTQISKEGLNGFKTIFLVVVFLINILGNSGVVATIARYHELRSLPRNAVLASLSVADLLMAVVIAFKLWVLHAEQSSITATTCEVFTMFFSVLIYVGVLHLFILSIDKYIGVFYPLHYRHIITVKRLVVVLTIVWLIPIATMASLPLFLREQNAVHLQSIFPYCIGPRDNSVDKTYTTFTYVHVCFLFIIPMVGMVMVYLKIAKISCYQSNRVGPLEAGSALYSGKSRTREMKWAKTLGIVIGAFTMGYLPILVMLLYQASLGSQSSLAVAIQFMSFANTAINPMVYSLRTRDYRKAFVKFFRNNNIRPTVVNALPGIVGPFPSTTTSSSQPRISGRRKSSLWIENSDLMTTSNSFTVFTSLHRTATLENILQDLMKSVYLYKEEAVEPSQCSVESGPSAIEKQNEVDSLPDSRLFSQAEILDRSSCALEPTVRIVSSCEKNSDSL